MQKKIRIIREGELNHTYIIDEKENIIFTFIIIDSIKLDMIVVLGENNYLPYSCLTKEDRSTLPYLFIRLWRLALQTIKQNRNQKEEKKDIEFEIPQ